ncbi:MAG: 3-deoxy-manno-octulosonate cytidylyltransferase, partial [Gammaproteobacteria bacterium]|nr:3-deoxy-manno-octulosonate cytidylyltransferase [Gammaproteobacteria bacterium]
MSYHVIIPARYASTRLPGKPLADVEGKPLIQRVYECSQNCSAKQVIIATDDKRIAAVVEGFGGQVCMTSADHPTGTDRMIEVIEKCGIGDEEIVVNLQGDEPFMPGEVIEQVAANLQRHGDAVTATVSTPIDNPQDLFDP